MPFFSNAKNNPEDMYQIIYDTYRDSVFTYIAGKVSYRNDIFDILQNVFVHLWQYRKTLGGPNTENIIFKTCNQEISHFVKQQAKGQVKIESYSNEADNSEDQLQDKLQTENQLIALNDHIEMLPSLRKQIFTMNKLEGVSQEQIAKELNLSRSAVENQISKAMLFLKKNYSDP